MLNCNKNLDSINHFLQFNWDFMSKPYVNFKLDANYIFIILVMPLILSLQISVCNTPKIDLSSIVLPKELPPVPVKIDLAGSAKDIDFEKVGQGVGKVLVSSLKNVGSAMNEGTGEWSQHAAMAGKNVGNAQVSFLTGMANGAEEAAPQIRKIGRSYFGSFFDLRDIASYAINVGIGFAISASLYYGVRLLWTTFETFVLQKMREPKVLIRKKMGILDRIKSWFWPEQQCTMILDDEVKDRLLKLVRVTKTTNTRLRKRKHNRLFYKNILLWGPPGTGKTMFARYLAHESGMDFAETTGGAFFQDGAGIQAIDSLFDWAEASDNGLVIFIDEADSLFVDRSLLTAGSLEHRVVNHFLNRLGQASQKFLLVAATNHKVVLDAAMQRRIQELIYMPLPSLKTRRELIEFKVKELFETEYDTLTQQVLKQLFSNEKNLFIAQLVNGFSHADIVSMFEVIKTELELLEEQNSLEKLYVIIDNLVTDIVTKYIDKAKSFTISKQEEMFVGKRVPN